MVRPEAEALRARKVWLVAVAPECPVANIVQKDASVSQRNAGNAIRSGGSKQHEGQRLHASGELLCKQTTHRMADNDWRAPVLARRNHLFKKRQIIAQALPAHAQRLIGRRVMRRK